MTGTQRRRGSDSKQWASRSILHDAPQGAVAAVEKAEALFIGGEHLPIDRHCGAMPLSSRFVAAPSAACPTSARAPARTSRVLPSRRPTATRSSRPVVRGLPGLAVPTSTPTTLTRLPDRRHGRRGRSGSPNFYEENDPRSLVSGKARGSMSSARMLHWEGPLEHDSFVGDFPVEYPSGSRLDFLL